MIYRKIGNGPEKAVRTAAGNKKTSWTDIKAKTGGTLYTYRVAAFKNMANKRCFTSYSDPMTVLRIQRPAAAKITHSSNGITVSWEKVDGAQGYILQKRTSGGSFFAVQTFESADTVSYTDPGPFTAGVEYDYKVAAINNVSNIMYSGFESAPSGVILEK